jgi:hypothetical protein
VQHPPARYELDWKTPEQLLVAAVLADGSRDAAVTDVTKVLFARWPDTRALAKADIAQLTQVSCRTPRQPRKPGKKRRPSLATRGNQQLALDTPRWPLSAGLRFATWPSHT